ncbi:hypothetical protein SAMN05216266_11212 [Amycolatopsis marina]|uniref:DUF6286 domain-containing protein n=1 Tax=Amycolatopsis marina TaxID=490629 RepID=A0A1I1B4B2_9PSEU|nr:DUF6286 domain-containing protein [Amycolatopsis marina]SFB45184.1 hypothetical protein SAMN05216266_11212 [Amycolatopsis marina]
MRVLVRLLSTLLALAAVVIGAVVALEVAWQWWRPAEAPLLAPWPRWRDALAELTWDSGAVRVLAAVVAGAGLLLVLIALAARRRGVLLHDPATDVSVSTSPRSLARLVGHRVRAQDKVERATVTASAKKVRVRAISTMETEGELRPRLLATVSELLGEIPLARTPKVSVVVDSPKDRR